MLSNKVRVAIAIATTCLCFAIQQGQAQTTVVTREGIVVSRALSGRVEVGMDEMPVRGATVELCSANWKDVLASVKTDDDGHFSLQHQSGKLFYLRVSSPGLNTYRLRVRVDKRSKDDLTIRMDVAT